MKPDHGRVPLYWIDQTSVGLHESEGYSASLGQIEASSAPPHVLKDGRGKRQHLEKSPGFEIVVVQMLSVSHVGAGVGLNLVL